MQKLSFHSDEGFKSVGDNLGIYEAHSAENTTKDNAGNRETTSLANNVKTNSLAGDGEKESFFVDTNFNMDAKHVSKAEVIVNDVDTGLVNDDEQYVAKYLISATDDNYSETELEEKGNFHLRPQLVVIQS